MPDDDLIDRAVRAYFRHAQRSAVPPGKPNIACCEVRDGKVTVANSYRILAQYRIRKYRLVRLTRPDAGVVDPDISGRPEVQARQEELMGALADAGFALADVEEDYLRVVPNGASRGTIVTDWCYLTPDSIVDRHGLMRGFVLEGAGDVFDIIAHFTQRWSISRPMSEGGEFD